MHKFMKCKKNNKHISRFRIKNQAYVNTSEHHEPEDTFFHKIGF